MPRYELVEGTSSKFWQIERDGASFKTTHGRIGSSGTTLLKEWPSEAIAEKEYAKLVAEKTKKGYQLVGGDDAKPAAKQPAAAKADKAAKPAAKAKAKAAAPAGGGDGYNAALAKQIDADPTDEAAWAVYGDWLQSVGDPRGELGVTQEKLRAAPKDKELLAAEKKLLKQHADQLVGKQLFGWMITEKSTALPSVLAKAPLEPQFRTGGGGEDGGGSGPPIRVFWRHGFFAKLIIGHPGYDWSPPSTGDDDDDGGGGDGELDIAKVLAAALAHPSARFLTSLRLGMPMNPEDGEQDYGDVLKTLATLDATTRLRELYIGDIAQEESEISWIQVGNLAPLYPKLRQLRSLTIHAGGDLDLGKIDLPELRELILISGGLAKKNLAAICAAKWPKLEKLELWTGSKSYGGDSGIADLKPILDGKAFPKLVHLGLRNSEYSDEIAAALPTAKILRQLSALDLSKGTLSDAGVTAMLAHVDAFQHLRKLDLSDNFVAKTSAAASKLTSAVRTRPQRTPDNYDGESRRYVSVSE